MELEKYFGDFKEKISFIELKDSYEGDMNKEIFYPIITDELIDGIKTGDFHHELDIHKIIDGMVILLNLDPDFKYNEDYENLLIDLGDGAERYIFAKGIQLLQEDNQLNVLYFKYLAERNLAGEYAKYNYARGLYYLYQKYGDGELFVEAYRILEKLTMTNEDFPLSYYLLGIININQGRHLKAKIYLEKALNKSQDESSKEEIREIIHHNEPKALIEKGIEYLSRANTDKAFLEFQKSKALEPNGIVNYYLAYVLDRTGHEDEARPLYEEALEDGITEPEIYIDLANLYFKKEQFNAALSVLNKGLDKNTDNEQLLYNRMIINLAGENNDAAKEDYDKLLEYADINPVILDNLLALKDNFD